jgi:branched-chain amino acid transport system ATP-binding protein
MSSPLLRVAGLHAFHGATPALHGIDLDVQAGGITALLGANGAGKTTTLQALCGMLPVKGQIEFTGRQIAGWATERIAALGIAHVPEGRGTFLHLSVRENLRLGAHLRKRGADLEADHERMLDLFPQLRQRLNQQAGTLSGGEQQMLAIARALMMKPRLLLLDEPSFGLAPRVVLELFEVLRQISQTHDLGMLLVEQNAGLALDLADQAYLLETGRIVLAGPARQVRADPAVRRAYLGA